MSSSRCFPSIKSDASKAWWHQARIYHILIDRFNGGWIVPPESKDEFIGGTLKGIEEKIDYIQNKGFNAIMLSPFFSSKAYHGYHTLSYEQVDEHFGTWEDFQKLVNAAHEKKMKVICDYVPNHCHDENPLFVKAFNHQDSRMREWFYFKGSLPTDYVSFLHYAHMPKFNLKNEETAEYLIGVAEKLVKEHRIDGIRIDHVIGLPFDFLRKLQRRIKGINEDVFVFGEATATGIKKNEYSQIEFVSKRHREYAEAGQLSRDELQSQYEGVIDGVLDFAFRDIIIEEIVKGHHLIGNQELVEKLDSHFSLYPEGFAPVLFLDNHDTNRFMYYCHEDKSLLDEALEFMSRLQYPISVYYGTEQYMTNDPSIEGESAEPYADLRVRLPMDWSMT